MKIVTEGFTWPLKLDPIMMLIRETPGASFFVPNGKPLVNDVILNFGSSNYVSVKYSNSTVRLLIDTGA